VDSTELMRGLRRGEPQAFDAVYAACAPRLFRFVARLTRSPELAAELVQETWLRFAAHARGLPEEVEPAAWLFRVARNLYLSERRRTLLGRERLAQLFHWLAAGRASSSPFEQLAASETQRELERAIAHLPRPQRELFLLVAVERLDPSEAAQILGIAPEAARQRLARARERLRRALNETGLRLEAVGDEP
jgi:RNA polymerase sigma factor (sigma-70 family)